MGDTPESLWQCKSQNCGAMLQEAELRQVVLTGLTVPVCPHCGGAVRSIQPIATDGESGAAAAPSFASALTYPFHGWGWVVLGTGTILVGLLAFGLPFLYGYVITILVYGYICSYLFDIVYTTATDDDTPPGFHESAEWWDDILQPILLVLSTSVLCFSPALLYFIGYLIHCWYEGWVPYLDDPVCLWGVLGSALLCYLYYPMALLAAIMHNARRAADPRLVIPSIRRVPVPYLKVCGFMMLTLVIQAGFRLAFNTDSLLVHFASVFLKLWSWMVSMRLLGLLYRVHRDDLAWPCESVEER